MTDFKLSFRIVSGSFEEQQKESERLIAVAATGAMDEAIGQIKPAARADIAAAGFSRRWQNALRINRYPSRKGSIALSPAAYIYHKIEYAGVFEDGATIQGDPLLWLPLSSTPQRISGNLMTARRMGSIIPGKFISMKSRTGLPLLAAQVRVSKTQSIKDRPKVTLAALKRGKEGDKGVLRTIPLFFGVRKTTIGKKLNIREICARAQAQIPSLYAKQFAEANANG